jgi:predicted dehydrogenase
MNSERKEQGDQSDFNRRDFLKSSSISTMMMMMGGVALRAEDKPPATATPSIEEEKHTGPPVKCAVIGCGIWGLQIANTLARLPNAPVVAVCDTYAGYLRRGKEAAPKAEGFKEYQKVLESKDVQAVFVATPSYQHKEIVLAALQAGKHVYCEAPLANTLEDARAIAQAAKNSPKLNFQSGMQLRSDPHRQFLVQFIRAGAMGRPVRVRAQWNKKQSWRRTWPDAAREKELNWRLSSKTSLGLVGEMGIHQIDVINWFLRARPVSVTGFGSLVQWTDGRDVPDTVQAVFEYPGGVLCGYESTLANSFDSDYEMFYGTDSAVMLRGNKAWMFKEVDAPLLGWEVYARKDEFFKESGIALVANATKLVAQGNKPVEEAPYTNTPLSYALEAFIANSATLGAGVEDFNANFGENPKALKEYLATLAKSKVPCASYEQGFEANVIAIKANEAITKGQRITFEKEWFEI